MKSILFFQNLANVAANWFNMTKIEFPIPQARGAHAEERNLAVQHGIGRIRSRMQVFGSMALGDEIAHLGLDDRTAARLHGFDLGRAEVDSNYVMPLVREAGRRDRAHVT